MDFGYGSLTLWGAIFQSLHLSVAVSYRGPTTPEAKPPVWAVPLSLATTDGITSFSFPAVTEMFQLSAFATYTYGFSASSSEISGSTPV